MSPRSWPSATFGLRLASSAVLGPLVLLAIYFGSPSFDMLVIAAMAVLAWEWSRLFAAAPPALPGILLVITLVGAVAAVAVYGPQMGASLLFVGLVLVLLASRNLWLAAGVLYFGLPGLALLSLRHDPECGRFIAFWLVAVVWASDIGAYLVGSKVGGPKLAPAISPNKTWSGFVGGMASAVLVGTSVAALASTSSLPRMAAFSAGVGLSAHAGDLAESWIKRRFHIKDVSGLIPGHGGLLDRVDGLLFASLVTALIAAWVNGSICTWN